MGIGPRRPTRPGAFAYASLESQYDILDTIQYLLTPHAYNVDKQSHLSGGLFDGRANRHGDGAKYPDVFAAVFDNKGPTDFGTGTASRSPCQATRSRFSAMRQECYTGRAPAPRRSRHSGNLFCYHRRSSVELARNLIHEPISMTHSFDDMEVPITHSITLRDDDQYLWSRSAGGAVCRYRGWAHLRRPTITVMCPIQTPC